MRLCERRGQNWPKKRYIIVEQPLVSMADYGSRVGGWNWVKPESRVRERLRFEGRARGRAGRGSQFGSIKMS